MIRLRKWLILVHRWLGIGLSLLFLTWFVSGIAMIYAGGMPALTSDLRLERLPAIDLSRVRLTLAEAAAKAGLLRNAGRVTLLTVMDRPAYRFAGGMSVTVFADNGELLDVGDAESLTIASRFMSLPPSSLHQVAVLERADQWTIGQRRQVPLHKFVVDPGAPGIGATRTELYVSEQSGEVAMLTTRRSRALAWAAAIPHWLYLAPLRLNDQLWRQVVLWTSGLGSVSALIGIVLAVIQYRTRYAGWMRWHYLTGAVFGVFALTWVFSGFLSMEPWDWASGGGSGARIPQTLSGGALNLAAFPKIDSTQWSAALVGRGGGAVKEIEFRQVQGEPHYLLRDDQSAPTLVAAKSLQVRREPFSIDSIVQRVRDGNPGVPMPAAEMLSTYDSYYYDQARDAPLPVLRFKFDDPAGTWVYIDPGMSQLVARFTRRERLQRWIYHGFHSLDFSFWYYNRPLWDIGVIVLCSGGAVLSLIGVVIGFKRLGRNLRRRANAAAS